MNLKYLMQSVHTEHFSIFAIRDSVFVFAFKENMLAMASSSYHTGNIFLVQWGYSDLLLTSTLPQYVRLHTQKFLYRFQCMHQNSLGISRDVMVLVVQVESLLCDRQCPIRFIIVRFKFGTNPLE